MVTLKERLGIMNVEMDPLIQEKVQYPPCWFLRVAISGDWANFTAVTFALAKNKKPQCIAHRGYKAAWPENTMGAFKGAVEVGAHAIELDLHLSKDGVVVISHVGSSHRIGVADAKYTGHQPQALLRKGGKDH